MTRPDATTDHLDADLVVIGYGKGGKTLAAELGKRGQRVVMIEQSAQMYGGTCINIGCVPTKSMVFRAEHLDGDPEAYRQAIDATAELTALLRGKNLAMLENIPTATVLTGRAEFVGPDRVEVHTSDGVVTVTGRTIVIGTGSEPVIPDIPGLQGNPRVVTSTDLLSTEQLPDRLVVLGGGYVGLEFAAMYARYGSKVTVLERHSQILGHEDADVAAAALDILSELTVVTSADVTRVDGATVHYSRGGADFSIEADAILVALGRRPVTAGLGLDKAGVRTNSSGAIVVDEHLRTSVPHVFAVGDVNGGPQFTYVSLDDYRIVLDQLTGTGTRSTRDRVAVPYSLFITPPLSRVGLTESQAVEAGRAIKTASMRVADMATVPRARIVGEPVGMMKVIVDADDDTIVGAALLSYDSHEVINTVALAMRHGITAAQLRDEIYTHPSMTEAFNQLLGALA